VAKPRVLCIFSQVLGNRTFSARLQEAVATMDSISPIYLPYEPRDYKRYPVPKVLDFSDTLGSAWRIKKKYLDMVQGSVVDMLFFQSYSLTPFFYGLIKRLPTAVALDTTPRLAHALIQAETKSLAVVAKSKVGSWLASAAFNRILRHVDAFLPRTQWCADSLIADFHVSARNISVTYCPVDLEKWRPTERANQKPVLLFVGNDFQRKGGEFLLDLHQRYFRQKYLLRIVSNDASIGRIAGIEGVEVVSGVSHDELDRLIEIYQASDLFVLPTRREQLGLVLTEAIATGLPAIATDVGGVRELVKDGFNGHLMPYESGPEKWAERIDEIIRNPDVLRKFGANSRRIAEEKLCMSMFAQTVHDVLRKLVALKS
jgi:glycosyltransferase involved in cell wall biosynthesis